MFVRISLSSTCFLQTLGLEKGNCAKNLTIATKSKTFLTISAPDQVQVLTFANSDIFRF